MNISEYLNKDIKVKIDRPMGSRHPKHDFIYPINYGYVPNTISGDGEELDCYVLGVFEPLKEFEGKCIAIIHRLNDNDDKLIVVPKNADFSNEQIEALIEFQERFFKHEIIRKDKDKKSMKPKENKNYYYELLDFFNENEKLKLTNNNATFIEAVLKIDSRYKDSGNLNKYPSKEYIDYLKYGDINIYDDKIHEYGSGKYWINKLVIIIESNNIDYEIAEKNLKYEKKSNNTEENEIIDSLNLETIIKGTVCAIDRENSTHLTAHHSTSKVGRSNVSKIIYEEMKKGLEEFKNKLLKDDNFPLIGLITVPKEKDKENYHYSLATKFCKYLSLGFEKDKYYIYDNIIISNIDYYIKKYNLNEDEYNMKSLKFEKNDYTKDNKEIKCIKISEKYKKLWIFKIKNAIIIL